MTLNEAINRLETKIIPRLYNPDKADEEALVIATRAIKAIQRINIQADKYNKVENEEEL